MYIIKKVKMRDELHIYNAKLIQLTAHVRHIKCSIMSYHLVNLSLNLCLRRVNFTDNYSNNNMNIYEAYISNQIEYEALAVVM